MQNKKVFILLPDGVGLRNFAFTDFLNVGLKQGFESVYWNNTVFDFTPFGFNEIKITHSKSHPLTSIYKEAKNKIEINLNVKKTKNNVYKTYSFPVSYNNIKATLKNIWINLLILKYSSNKGLIKIRNKIKSHERKTLYYYQSIETLKKEQPALVFCTNQRHVTTIAPIIAAQDLNIPTATFIFSWDNLPKATMVIETDFYFVWSQYMKEELLFYYPFINQEQIYITGTPQFEKHFDSSVLMKTEDFFLKYKLDSNKKYICFSGDDTTTSPDDQQYLEDIAKAVVSLNKNKNNFGIIFRRCPVDFSNRYDEVIKKYSDIIVSIDPLWVKNGELWNTVMPTKKDLNLLVNIINNCEMVINMGSSMVFDFVALNKPCLYINYDVVNKNKKDWSTKKIYNFIHFKSMPSQDPVFWINNPNEIESIIEKIINKEDDKVVENAKIWFKKINEHPPEKASVRIWSAIQDIMEK